LNSNRSRAVRSSLLAAAIVAAGGALSCSSAPSGLPPNAIPVGLLLSYSGYLAANSINSERALIMALEAGNAAGGIEGRPLALLPRDTRSRSGNEIEQRTNALFDDGASILIGPDTIDLVTQLRPLLTEKEHTILLPSFETASDVGFGSKPIDWFVMGPGTGRIACELNAQLVADKREKALVITNAKGYNSAIAWYMTNLFGMPKYILPTQESAATATVQSILEADVDAYVLAAFPADATSLVYALAAAGALKDPTRLYLSPTLHTPAFLATLPNGVLAGARGVAPGTVAGAGEFRDRFTARWQDVPLDDAYSFYDAGAVAALAIERALVRTGEIPTGTGLTEHVLAVTQAGNHVIAWNELDQGLALLHAGKEVEYSGLSGILEFDSTGQAHKAPTRWWRVSGNEFVDVAESSNCK
jgi:ABC-type branched-subunit amino acid transport system substrate-binding protein